MKRSGDLSVIEKWEAYVLPNHLCSWAIPEEHFLEGTRLLASFEKINSSFLRKEFRRDFRRFLEVFVSTILSTAAARSPIGQGLSCFCPEIVIRGDDFSAFYLFGQLLDGLLELGCVRGRRWKLQRLKSTFLYASSDRWRQAAIDLVCRSVACLPSAISLVSVLGGNCTKLVLLCFSIISIISWSNTCGALGLSVDSISGEGSFRITSRIYCFARWGCDWTWPSERGSGVCAGFCASPFIHTEKLFLWDWDQHAEYCCHCCRCCPKLC